MNYVLYARGKYGIFNGNVFKLSEDLAILKPTIFASVPRLYSRFYDVINGKVKDLSGFKGWAYRSGLKAKQDNIRSKGKVTHTMWDNLVFNKMKNHLGGKCQILLTASAPIDQGVLEFLKIHFCAPIMEAYGQTEATGGEFASGRFDPIMGHVGGPSPCNEFKLVDVPDMKYTSEDVDEKGRKCPRGEICVRGANVIPGYYKNDEKTKETIDEDGWLLSGDIGMILPGSNALKIFDRKKNIFKLQQGEYVAPEKLENCLKMCPMLADIYVYGDSLQAVLIGIVNADETNVKKFAAANKIEGTFEELCVNDQVIGAIRKDIDNQQKISKFKGFERIKHFYVDPKLFDSNGLLTTTFKIKRNDAKAFYQEKIDELYAKEQPQN